MAKILLTPNAPKAGGPGSIPAWGTRSHLPQLKMCMLKRKILHATAKTWCSQISKYLKKREREKNPREFLGNPVVKTPKFPLQRTQVPSLVGEPRSRKPSGFVTKK